MKVLCTAVFLLIFIIGFSAFRAEAAEETESAAEAHIPAVINAQTEPAEAQTEAQETEAEPAADETEPTEDETDPALEEVKSLLAGIDSLEEMQYYRVTVTREVFRNASGGYASGNYAKYPEQHQEAQSRYQNYLDDMFAKRAAAKAAYEALTEEQKTQIAADETAAANLAKLTPYDELPTAWFTQDRIIIAQTSQTAEQLQLPISITPVTDPDDPYIYEFVRCYEISFAYSNAENCEYPSSYALVDTTKISEGTWMPNEFYNYGTSNYLVAYCCDAEVNAHRGMHYKRVNLEDADYYTEENAKHIRTIILNSYPFVSIEEMKQFLVDNGFDPEMTRKLTRSDLIAAVQWAVWHYSNYVGDAAYTGTAAVIEARDRRDYLLLPSLHDYRNEDWTWYLVAPGDYYSCSAYRYTFYEDIQERVDALTQFLLSLPGTEPDDKQIAISSIEIARTALIPGEDGTFEIDLNVFLNHGTTSAEDSVMLDAYSLSEDGTVTRSIPKPVEVNGKTVYKLTVQAKDGDTVNVIVNGTQELERGVYFYETAGGHEESQCFVNVAEGSTRVHAEKAFTFNRDTEMGIRVYKTASGSNLPLSDITFRVYHVNPEEGETISEVPTAEEIEKYAVEANLAGTLTTDNTGYAFLQLERGTYLVVEELNAEKVKEVVSPFYVTLPNPVEGTGDDGVTTVEYQDIVPLYIENIPLGAAEAQFEVTKEFNDWGKAESFRFELKAVTENAPMPKETTVMATKENPVAVFGKLAFDKAGTYEYTITEINDGADGVAYDTAAHRIVVNVSRAENNGLTADVKYDGAPSLTVTNTYSPVKAPIEVTKEFNDWGKADSFVFTLSAAEGMPMPENTRAAATKDAPTASFGEVTFEKAGIYEYVITEINGGADGVAYDTAEHHVVITVSKAADTNALSADVKYDGEPSLVITNTFTPVQAAPKMTKVLEGRDWNEDDAFTFALAAVTEGAPLPEKLTATATKEQPTVSFGKILYHKAGIYEYTITEVNDHADGMSYDTEAHPVTVTVTKDTETNALTAVVTYSGANSLTIVNSYRPATAVPEVTKTLTGRDWVDGDTFTFTLAAVTEGAPLPEKLTATATKEQPTVRFGTITYDKAGTYEYTITEEAGRIPGVTYDNSPHKVLISVTKDETNELSAAVSYDGQDTLVVENRYEAEPVTVVFDSRKTVEGQPKNNISFRFILKETTEGADYQDELVITGEGSGSFKPIRFESAGVYTFEISEEIGSLQGWTYDSRIYKVTVTVTDDGSGQLTAAVEGLEEGTAEFCNTYMPETTPDETLPEETTPAETTPTQTEPAETTPPETTPHLPDTGEGNLLAVWGTILGIALLAGILLLIFRQRIITDER